LNASSVIRSSPPRLNKAERDATQPRVRNKRSELGGFPWRGGRGKIEEQFRRAAVTLRKDGEGVDIAIGKNARKTSHSNFNSAKGEDQMKRRIGSSGRGGLNPESIVQSG